MLIISAPHKVENRVWPTMSAIKVQQYCQQSSRSSKLNSYSLPLGVSHKTGQTGYTLSSSQTGKKPFHWSAQNILQISQHSSKTAVLILVCFTVLQRAADAVILAFQSVRNQLNEHRATRAYCYLLFTRHTHSDTHMDTHTHTGNWILLVSVTSRAAPAVNVYFTIPAGRSPVQHDSRPVLYRGWGVCVCVCV